MVTSIHPSIHPCLVSFLFIPSLYIPSFKSKDFSFTCNNIIILAYTMYINRGGNRTHALYHKNDPPTLKYRRAQLHTEEGGKPGFEANQRLIKDSL